MAGASPSPVIDTVERLMARSAMRSPRTVSISEPGRNGLTHEELEEFTGEIAARLCGFGVSRTHRLAMAVDVGAEALTCSLAVMRCAAGLPLNPGYRQTEFGER